MKTSWLRSKSVRRRHNHNRRPLRLEALEEKRLLTVTAVDDDFTIDEDTVLKLGSTVAANLGDQWLYFDEIARTVRSYPDGNQTGVSWNDLAYDTNNPEYASWKTGNALFAYGPINAGPTVTGLNGPSSNYTTHLFRRTFTLDANQAQATSGTLDYVFDDGAIIYINGNQVQAVNMPTTATTDTFASGNGNENTYTQVTVDLTGAGLVEGDNLLAVEVHNVNATSSDVGMDMSLSINSAGGGILENDSTTYFDKTLTASVRTQPTNGTLELNDDGTFTYTPNAEFSGIDSFMYWAKDQQNLQNSATVTITVNPIEDPPVATDDTYTVSEDGVLVATATGTSPPDEYLAQGSTWYYIDTLLNSNVPPTGPMDYPVDGSGRAWNAPDFDRFSSTLSWKQGPAQFGFGGINAGAHATVLGGQSDAPNGQHSVSTYLFRSTFDVADPTSVAELDLGLLSDDGGILYINGQEVFRTANLVGKDVIADLWSGTPSFGEAFNTGIRIDVSGILNAGSNTVAYELHQQTGTSSDLGFDLSLTGVPAANGFLANDYDPEGSDLENLQIIPGSGPSDGVFELDPAMDGRFTYTPNPNFNGTDSFQYTIDAGGMTSRTATVTINVTAVTDQPVAAEDRYYMFGNRTLVAGMARYNDDFSQGTILLPDKSNWFFSDDGSDQDTRNPNWKTAGFNPAGASGWNAVPGQAEFGLGDGSEQTLLRDGPTTYYFQTEFEVADPAAISRLVLHTKSDDGEAVYINGVEVLRHNLADGAGYLTTAGGATYDREVFEGSLVDFSKLAGGNPLVAGKNSVAVEVHQTNPSDGQFGFDMRINVPTTEFGVRANDFDPDGDSQEPDPTIARFPQAEVTDIASGEVLGTVLMQENGTFQWAPPLGYVGDAEFAYTLLAFTGGREATGRVVITVGESPDPPIVTVEPLLTNAPSPELTGVVSHKTAAIEVEIAGTTYNAINNGDLTWTLPAGQILDLTEGTYDVIVRAIAVPQGTGTDNTADELEIDLTPSWITIDPLVTNQDSPMLTGTVGERNIPIQVTIDGNTYGEDVGVKNNGDGSWTLPAGVIAPLASGIYDVLVEATDLAGNVGADSTIDELEIDVTAPNIAVDVQTHDDSTPPITGTVDDQLATVSVTIGTFTYDAINNGNGTWLLPDDTLQILLGNGVYDVMVSSTDPVGNTGYDATTDELTIDLQTIRVTVDDLLTNDQMPELTGTVDDPDATVSVTVEGNAYPAVNNTDGTWTLPDNTITTPLSPGVYTVAGEAANGAVAAVPATGELKIDNIAPQVTVDLLTTNDSTPELTGTIDDGDGPTVRVLVNGITYTAEVDTVVNGDGTWNWTLPDGTIPDIDKLDHGVYEVLVTGTDRAGNWANDLTNNELDVDLVAPTVLVNSLLTNDNTPELTGTVLTGTVNGTEKEPTAAVLVIVDGIEYEAVNNGDTTWTLPDDALPALADGVYDVQVSVQDAAGNVGTDDTLEDLTVDTTPPEITVDAIFSAIDQPAITGTVEDLSFEVTVWVEGGAPHLAGTFERNGIIEWELPAGVIEPFNDGVNSVFASTLDAAGNPNEASGEVTIDTTAPSVTVDPNQLRNEASPLITGTVDDPTALIELTVAGRQYNATNNGDGTWTLPAGTTAALTDEFNNGVYDVAVTATDQALNSRTDDTLDELTIDLTLPVVSVDMLLTNDPTPELTGGIDEAGLDVWVRVNGTDYPATNNNDGTWVLPNDTVAFPGLADGRYDVEVSATDAAGNTGVDPPPAGPFERDLTVDTTAPLLSVRDVADSERRPAITVDVGEVLALQPPVYVEITIGVGDQAVTYQYEAAQDPISPRVWTVPQGTIEFLPDGTYDVVARATDAAGNVGFDVTTDEIVINNDPPDVTADNVVTNRSRPAITGTVSNIDATVEVEVAGWVYWATPVLDSNTGLRAIDEQTGYYLWEVPEGTIFPLGFGVYEAPIRATDPAGNVGEAVAVLRISNDFVPPEPIIDVLVTNDPTPEITGTFGDVYDVQVILGVTVLINGIAYEGMNNEDGTWSVPDGTITEPLPDGVYDITITAEDEVGNLGYDATIDELTIDTAPPTVQIQPVTPDIRIDSVNTIVIEFDQPVKGFDFSDLVLTRNGGDNLLPGESFIQTEDGQVWMLSNLRGLTVMPGRYELSVISDNGDIVDPAGNALEAGVTEAWSVTRHPYTNPVTPRDVNGDGFISPVDALIVINNLNANGSRALPVNPDDDEMPPPFFDVNDDGFLTPVDALQIINYLNSTVGAPELEPEGEPVLAAPLAADLVLADVDTPIVPATRAFDPLESTAIRPAGARSDEIVQARAISGVLQTLGTRRNAIAARRTDAADSRTLDAVLVDAVLVDAVPADLL